MFRGELYRNKNVLEASTTNKIKKFIFASSEVYGEPDSNPITEKILQKEKQFMEFQKLL